MALNGEILRAVIKISELGAQCRGAPAGAASLLEDSDFGAARKQPPGAGESGDAGADDRNAKLVGKRAGFRGAQRIVVVRAAAQVRASSGSR